MPYVLGIDVGTRFTAAAVCRLRGSDWGVPEVVPLGARSPLLPSTVHLGRDGTVLVGEPAEQRAPAEPDRVARELGSRIGDEVPLMLGGQPCTAAELTAVLIRAIVDQVEAAEGDAADRILITHRAGWGNYRRGLLRKELGRQGLSEVALLPEAIAAAEGHAGHEPVYVGEALAVYGLGSTTFEAAVVRRVPAGGFELLAASESVEHVAGNHFDDVVVDHVRTELGKPAAELDPRDPTALHAMAILRQQCTAAKESLSVGLDAVIPARLPTVSGDVRLTRAEFEELIRPAVDGTVETLLRAVRTATTPESSVGDVLLVGGSVRVPLVRDMVTAAVPGRAICHPEPELGIARGAALAGRRLLAATGVGPALPPPAEQTMVFTPDALARRDSVAADLALPELDPEPPARPPIELTPLELPEYRLLRRYAPALKPMVLGIAVAVVMVVGVVLTLMYYPHTGGSSPQTPSSAFHTTH